MRVRNKLCIRTFDFLLYKIWDKHLKREAGRAQAHPENIGRVQGGPKGF